MIGLLSDEVSQTAINEYRAEKVDDLFRRYVEQLHVAQSTHFGMDWLKTGQLFERFVRAAVAADIDPKTVPFEGAK